MKNARPFKYVQKVFVPKEISGRTIFAQTLAAAALALATFFVVCFFSLSKFTEKLTAIELDNLFAAIESGPTQFAYLNSAEIATAELKRLLEKFNGERHYLVSGQILSGEDMLMQYAEWKSQSSVSPSCLLEHRKEVTFPNSVYPFQILLQFDNCMAGERFWQIGVLLLSVAAGCLSIVLLLGCLILVPVVKSFRLAKSFIEGSSQQPNEIAFVPIRTLAIMAAKSKYAERDAAVARTTQALAHDVRKPLSMFKSIIQAVEATTDIEETRLILTQSIPDVNQAMNSVEGMVQDIMQIGTDAKPILETVSAQSVTYNALTELFRLFPNTDVSLDLDFRNSGLIAIDTTRFSRVFSNILGNAIQAMGGKGTVWIKTSDFEDRVLFKIGNSGSVIPEENLSQLFEAFFTSGKKGGTGLGLAIVKKIVEMHGGTIQCRSSSTEEFPDGFVEFAFSVPRAANTVDLVLQQNVEIPKHSNQFYDDFARLKLFLKSEAKNALPYDEKEEELAGRVTALIDKIDEPVNILLVDDESIYRTNIEGLLNKSKEMKHKIKVLHATNGTQALAALAEQNPILVIQDIDLGIGSENGIAVVKRLREAQFKGQICVHSNRFLQEDNRLALEAGAQYILPKPMTRSHLLQLLVVSLNGQQSLKLTTSAELAISQKSRPVSLQQVAMHIVVLDDSAAIRISWKTRFKDGKLTVFSSPEEFLAKIDAEPALLQSIDAIISDFHFDSKSKHDGFSFAAEFKKRSQLPLFLASDGEFIESEWLPLFKGILRKEVYSAAQISKLLNWERKL